MNSRDLLLLFTILYFPAFAGEADVLDVAVSCSSDSTCRFDVTVRHEDEGWKHYANKWDIVSPEGEILATRKLLHPHDDEQPFTRSLGDVRIPSGVSEVIVRAHDLVHGYGGKEYRVKLH